MTDVLQVIHRAHAVLAASERQAGISIEQRARDLLDRTGVSDSQGFSNGDVVELANLINTSILLAQGVIAQAAGKRVELVKDEAKARRIYDAAVAWTKSDCCNEGCDDPGPCGTLHATGCPAFLAACEVCDAVDDMHSSSIDSKITRVTDEGAIYAQPIRGASLGAEVQIATIQEFGYQPNVGDVIAVSYETVSTSMDIMLSGAMADTLLAAEAADRHAAVQRFVELLRPVITQLNSEYHTTTEQFMDGIAATLTAALKEP